jgi:hypothetical protein
MFGRLRLESNRCTCRSRRRDGWCKVSAGRQGPRYGSAAIFMTGDLPHRSEPLAEGLSAGDAAWLGSIDTSPSKSGARFFGCLTPSCRSRRSQVSSAPPLLARSDQSDNVPLRKRRHGAGSVCALPYIRCRSQAVLAPGLDQLPSDGQTHEGADDILLRVAVSKGGDDGGLGRGVPSLRSSRTAGAVRATMASISAEPESVEVRLFLAGAALLFGMQVQSWLDASRR